MKPCISEALFYPFCEQTMRYHMLGNMSSVTLLSLLLCLAAVLHVSAGQRTFPCTTDSYCESKYSASFVVCRDGYCHCSKWYAESVDGLFLKCTTYMYWYVLGGSALVGLIVSIIIRMIRMRRLRQLQLAASRQHIMTRP